ncbi:MAG: hypothetical protein ACPGQQ_02920 [Candidatus Puniceispirillaceae bacterium]
MNYPNNPGFQSHSETSREAANLYTNAGTLRAKILDRLDIYKSGLTADDLSIAFDIPCSTIAARMRELELGGKIIKTKMKHKTRYNRNAFMYVHAAHFNEGMGRAAVKKEKPADVLMMESEHGRFKQALENIAYNAPDHFNDSQYADWAERVAREALGQ